MRVMELQCCRNLCGNSSMSTEGVKVTGKEGVCCVCVALLLYFVCAENCETEN